MINERRIIILGITFLMLLNLTSGYMFEGGNLSIFVLRFFTVLATMIVQWEVAHRVIIKLRNRFPQRAQVKKRLTRTFLYYLCISLITQLLTDFLLDSLIDGKAISLTPLRGLSLVLQALLFGLTTIGLFEAVYYYNRYNRAEMEKETLLRTNLQSQLDSLKGQVNPHFLFNSLNSLSSLISKDPDKAEAFVEELSSVYRYLLRSNEQQLVTLEEELEFIHSYLQLLNTRFSNNLLVHLDIADHHREYLLPPLSLQLLVENAVKHNIVSSELPLNLYIFTTESDRLHIVNNLQKKIRDVASNKVGLSNITAKYRLLKQPDVEIKETEETFTVILPLIEAEEYALLRHEWAS